MQADEGSRLFTPANSRFKGHSDGGYWLERRGIEAVVRCIAKWRRAKGVSEIKIWEFVLFGNFYTVRGEGLGIVKKIVMQDGQGL